MFHFTGDLADDSFKIIAYNSTPSYEPVLNVDSISNTTNYNMLGEVFGNYTFKNQFKFGRPVYERVGEVGMKNLYLMICRTEYERYYETAWAITDNTDGTGIWYISGTTAIG